MTGRPPVPGNTSRCAPERGRCETARAKRPACPTVFAAMSLFTYGANGEIEVISGLRLQQDVDADGILLPVTILIVTTAAGPALAVQ
jgi:hypothetical protein